MVERAPAQAILYLPGTMRGVFDQSIDLVAHHLSRALTNATGRRYRPDGHVEEISAAPGVLLNQRRICCDDADDQDIVLVEYDYTAQLGKALTAHGAFGQFVRLCAVLLLMLPRICRLVFLPMPADHTRLNALHRSLVAIIYLSGLVLVFLVIGLVQKLFNAMTGATDKLGTQLSDPWKAYYDSVSDVLGTGFEWAGIAGLLLAIAISLFRIGKAETLAEIGREYYGVTRYLLAGEGRERIEAGLAVAIDDVDRRYAASVRHFFCFSMGAIIAGNYLFRRRKAPPLDPHWQSVTFMGFPYILVEAAFPGYFQGWQSPATPLRWQNIFLSRDVLGSRLARHLPQIFSDTPPALTEARVPAEREATNNPITRHMAYWGDDGAAPGKAFDTLARWLMAPGTGSG